MKIAKMVYAANGGTSMINPKPRDISPCERELLSHLKGRPGAYFGKTELSRFVHWVHGYDCAVMTANLSEHNILPDGLQEFAAIKYLGKTQTAKGWFTLILEAEPDEEKAFWIFFEILDEYLLSLDYEPIPNWEEIKDNIQYLNCWRNTHAHNKNTQKNP
ncbi:MAG: hypothetical protein IJ035_05710 [Oscillospiraceae bacterium]|nr:hypothetical protein [Oscillospiraceae bacterium]